MSSIGGLARYQYGASYGVGGLAQYLNSMSSGANSSGTNSSGTNSFGSNASGNGTSDPAATLLNSGLLGGSTSGGNGSAADKSLLGYTPPSYDFPTDSRGKPLVATMSDMTDATKPKDKLTIASQIGEAIRMQSDCSVQSGNASRITDLTTQTKTLLDAVNSVVGGLATTDGSVAPGHADPAIAPYKSSISTVLGKIASVAANLQVLTSKAAPDVASKTKSALATLNSEASTIAAQAGLDWSTLSKAGMTALTNGGSSAAVPRLIDYLA